MIIAGRDERVIEFAESIGLKTERLRRFSIIFEPDGIPIIKAEFRFTNDDLDSLKNLTRKYKLTEIE